MLLLRLPGVRITLVGVERAELEGGHDAVALQLIEDLLADVALDRAGVLVIVDRDDQPGIDRRVVEATKDHPRLRAAEQAVAAAPATAVALCDEATRCWRQKKDVGGKPLTTGGRQFVSALEGLVRPVLNETEERLAAERLGPRLAHLRELVDAFEAAVSTCPGVMSCYFMTGDSDYLLHVVSADTAHYEQLYRTYLSRFPGVARIRSSFSLRTVCQTTALPV